MSNFPKPVTLDSEYNERKRQQPIPPPSNPRQYRAIGLVRGKYQPSAEQLTQGSIFAPDGTEIEAVLLGRTISLVKNHLDLEKEHLWVVYPRTRQIDEKLHVQIVGVWEPETLNRQIEGETAEDEIVEVKDGYFSIRGEVVFYSTEEKSIVIKIKQAPKKEGDKTKFFKLKLQGVLSERPLRRFWELHVQLEGDNLVIHESKDMGALPIKKRPDGGGRPPRGKKPFLNKPQNDDRPVPASRPVAKERPLPKTDRPVPKPKESE
jgi:hypothetical protein